MRAIASVIAMAGPSVTLLKVDCEGAEYDILERLTPDAAALVSQVAMEVHRDPVTRSIRSLHGLPHSGSTSGNRAAHGVPSDADGSRGTVTVAARFRPARPGSHRISIGEPATHLPR